jgi:hypothetical protein
MHHPPDGHAVVDEDLGEAARPKGDGATLHHLS